MRATKIFRALTRRAVEAEKNRTYRIELDMKNNDELTVYLPGFPITRNKVEHDFSILTDDNKVYHFATLGDVAKYIDDNY